MKSRMIAIDNQMTGIMGINEVFTQLLQAGREPSIAVKNQLLEELAKYNYIPDSKQESYACAFLKEYEKFCTSEKGGGNGPHRTLGTWQGIPREEIPWFPTITDGLCNGCRACMNFCSNHVYGWDEETEKVRVANPYYCVVGCNTCASICKPKAIMFPPLEMLKSFTSR